VEDRDAGLRKRLETEVHPQIRFRILGFRLSPAGADKAGRTVAGTAIGEMTIRGQTRELEMPLKISVDDSRRVVIDGETTIKLTDYGVEVPSELGVISMEDDVKIWIALRARSMGKVSR
jgi:polyisoprenoid-binding protein YceI